MATDEDMAAVPFDTLALARKLEAAGFGSKQAGDMAAVLAETFATDLVTKGDLYLALQMFEQRLTIKMGGMSVAIVGVLAVLIKVL